VVKRNQSQKIGMVVYVLHLSDSTRIHHVFYVSLLRRYVGPPPISTPCLSPEVYSENVATKGVFTTNEEETSTFPTLTHLQTQLPNPSILINQLKRPKFATFPARSFVIEDNDHYEPEGIDRPKGTNDSNRLKPNK